MLGHLLKLGIHLDSRINVINCRQIGDRTFAHAALSGLLRVLFRQKYMAHVVIYSSSIKVRFMKGITITMRLITAWSTVEDRH